MRTGEVAGEGGVGGEHVVLDGGEDLLLAGGQPARFVGIRGFGGCRVQAFSTRPALIADQPSRHT
jgi:hypothetical protein